MKKILVDTSIWIEYFKGNKGVAAIIEEKNAHTVFIAGPMITELIQAIKTKSEKDNFASSLESLPRLAITDRDWLDAGMLGSALREKGITIPLPDLIIYTLAKNNNCSLCTLDKHFETINNKTAQHLELIGLNL